MNNSGEDIKKDAIKSEPIWYNDFADKLISENFLLTALEFHAELTESGREISKLKDFFSNPANFENQATNKPDVAANLGILKKNIWVRNFNSCKLHNFLFTCSTIF